MRASIRYQPPGCRHRCCHTRSSKRRRGSSPTGCFSHSYSYATSYPLSPPHLRAWRRFRLCCAAKFPSLCKNLNHSHTLECPADGKAERTLRLELVMAPGVEEQLLQDRPHLVIIAVRQLRRPVPQRGAGG